MSVFGLLLGWPTRPNRTPVQRCGSYGPILFASGQAEKVALTGLTRNAWYANTAGRTGQGLHVTLTLDDPRRSRRLPDEA